MARKTRTLFLAGMVLSHHLEDNMSNNKSSKGFKGSKGSKGSKRGKTPMTPTAASRIQSATAKGGNGKVGKGSFAARAQSAAAKNESASKGS